MNDRNNEKRKRWKRPLVIAAVTLGMIAVVMAAGWKVLDTLGKNSLYSAGKDAPVLSMPGESAAVGVSENEAAGQAATEQENWQEGWVRYNGKVYQYNNRILTFLFMGIDDMNKVSRKAGGQNGGQADGLFLLVINPDTKKISVVAINRNTMTEMDQYDADGNCFTICL